VEGEEENTKHFKGLSYSPHGPRFLLALPIHFYRINSILIHCQWQPKCKPHRISYHPIMLVWALTACEPIPAHRIFRHQVNWPCLEVKSNSKLTSLIHLILDSPKPNPINPLTLRVERLRHHPQASLSSLLPHQNQYLHSSSAPTNMPATRRPSSALISSMVKP
jgi:hypothetical protein